VTIDGQTNPDHGRRQLGTEDQGWVAHLARRTLRGEPLTIYGDGKQVRDVLYIDDLIDALLLARENIDLVAGRAFNLGGGPRNAVSVLQAVRYLSELAAVRPQIRHGPWRKGDQRYYVSDTRRFTGLTGWTSHIPVEQGMSRLCQWLLDHAPSGVLQATE
jgi:CDP-paratose 2-epimerase